MKSEKEIRDALEKVGIVDAVSLEYSDGVEEALQWILGNLNDEDFIYSDGYLPF